ncbi:MAG: MFS transporter [SAR202 cluster bacterium]|nr:MFS transporter [SAR202 cluster bacterium]
MNQAPPKAQRGLGAPKTAKLFPAQGSARAWVVFALWIVSSLLGFVAVFNLGILLPGISADLGLSPGEQGILGSAGFWGNLALGIPIGWLTTRFGPKAVIGWMLVLSSGLLFWQGWSPIFAALLAGRLLFGVCLLAIEPPGALLIQQWFPPHRVMFVNSLNNAAFGLIMGGGILLTPFILELAGGRWRVTFYVFGVVFAALTLAWLLLGKERRAPPSEAAQTQDAPETGLLTGTLKHRDLWAAGVGVLGASMAWSAVLSFFPTLTLNSHGISLRWSGGILALGLLGGGLAGLGAAYLMARADTRRAVLFLMGLCMAGGYAAMTLTDSIPLLMLTSFIAGAGSGYFPVLYTVPFQLPVRHSKQVSVSIAFFLTMVSAGSVLGPLATGYLQELFDELRLPLIIVGLSSLTLCLAGLMLRPAGIQTQPEKAPA